MKIINRTINVSMVIVVGVLVYALCLMFYPYKTYDLHTSPMEVLNPIVKAGECITIKVDAMRWTDKPCDVTLQLVNDSVILLPTMRSALPAGPQDLEWQLRIPRYADAGHYKLISTLTFKMNPLRTISKRHETVMFEVIK